MGALPLVTGMDLTLISNMGVGTDMITEFMVLLACWNLPKHLPEEYKKSAFYMKDSTLHTILLFIGFLMLGTSYVNLSDLTVPAAHLLCHLYRDSVCIYTGTLQIRGIQEGRGRPGRGPHGSSRIKREIMKLI